MSLRPVCSAMRLTVHVNCYAMHVVGVRPRHVVVTVYFSHSAQSNRSALLVCAVWSQASLTDYVPCLASTWTRWLSFHRVQRHVFSTPVPDAVAWVEAKARQKVARIEFVAILPTESAPTSFVDEWPPHVRRLVAAITHVACFLYFVLGFTQSCVVPGPVHLHRSWVATARCHWPFSCFVPNLAL